MARSRKSNFSLRNFYDSESVSELTSAANRLENILSSRINQYPGLSKLKTPRTLVDFSKTVASNTSHAEIMKRYMDFWLTRIVKIQRAESQRYERRRSRSKILPKLSVTELNESELKKLQVNTQNVSINAGIKLIEANSLEQFVSAIAARSAETVSKVASYLSPARLRTKLTETEIDAIFNSKSSLSQSQFKGTSGVSSLAILSYGNLVRAFSSLSYSDLYTLAKSGLITVNDAPYLWDAGGRGNSLGYTYGTHVGGEPPEQSLFADFLDDANVSQTRMKRMRSTLRKTNPNSSLIQELDNRIA